MVREPTKAVDYSQKIGALSAFTAMTDPLSSEIAEGTVLDGKFRIERVLGQGAMGVVVAARHLRLDERVAIKFLLPAALESKETVARFEREAQAAAKIRSEHVARVSDVGRLQTGAPYMVMEHLSGVDLKQYLAQNGPLPVEEAMHYILQASEALAEAHSLGIVHRDLKPANMFRITRADGSPSVKILDFGISKLQNANVSMTQTATMMGSPYYMSPEQMTSSKDVDARTDIWAMGVIVHQLLTGNVPFEGNTLAEVCAAVLSQKAPRLSESRKDIPFGLQEVLDEALQKKRENRLSNMAEFAQALAPFGQSEDVLSAERVSRVLGFQAPTNFGEASARTMVAPPYEAHADRDQTLKGAAHSQHPYEPPKTSGGHLVALGAAAFCLIGAVVYFATQSPPEDELARDSHEASAAAPPNGTIADIPAPSDSKVESLNPPAKRNEPQPEATAASKAAPTASVERAPASSKKSPAADTPPTATSPRPAPPVAARVELGTAPPATPDTAPDTPNVPQPQPSDPLEYYRDRR